MFTIPAVITYLHKQLFYLFGGVAQWTSHPPHDQEDPGSNPARVYKVFRET
jgi:hypothetical protein